MGAILAGEGGKDSGLLRRWRCSVDGLLNMPHVQRGEAKAHHDSLQRFSRRASLRTDPGSLLHLALQDTTPLGSDPHESLKSDASWRRGG